MHVIRLVRHQWIRSSSIWHCTYSWWAYQLDSRMPINLSVTQSSTGSTIASWRHTTTAQSTALPIINCVALMPPAATEPYAIMHSMVVFKTQWVEHVFKISWHMNSCERANERGQRRTKRLKLFNNNQIGRRVTLKSWRVYNERTTFRELKISAFTNKSWINTIDVVSPDVLAC